MAHMLISGGASCLPVTPGSIPGSGQSSGLWWFQAIVEKDHQDKQSPMGGGTSPAPNVPRARLRGPRGFSQALPHLTTLDCPDELKVSPETGNSHHDISTNILLKNLFLSGHPRGLVLFYFFPPKIKSYLLKSICLGAGNMAQQLGEISVLLED